MALKLNFDDVPISDANDPFDQYRLRVQERKAADIGLSPTWSLAPPTLEDAQAIISFAKDQVGAGTLLCQCSAGISRSSAAALLCLATWLGQGKETLAITRVKAVRPAATPHAGLVEFGDKILGREGALLRELSQ